MSEFKIIQTSEENVLEHGLCGYKSPKRPGFPEKVGWLKDRLKEGLVIKTLYSEDKGTQGMIEYIPGEYCWRPVSAKGYMFIHCLFVGFKKDYKNKGYASSLIDECEKNAKDSGKNGVAIVTRKSSFMVDKDIFLKKGYELVDKGGSDFELLVKKYNQKASDPKFINNEERAKKEYKKGLTIIRADQCPYTVKNVNEIKETALKQFGIKAKVINLENYKEAQSSPCIFGIFCIIYEGNIVAEHPISNGRFVNIMNKIYN
jgi:YoaP-like protein